MDETCAVAPPVVDSPKLTVCVDGPLMCARKQGRAENTHTESPFYSLLTLAKITNTHTHTLEQTQKQEQTENIQLAPCMPARQPHTPSRVHPH